MLDQQFFKGGGLLELGCCSRYMMDKRNINYPVNLKRLQLYSFFGLTLLEIDLIINRP